jgi:hypothetical protein
MTTVRIFGGVAHNLPDEPHGLQSGPGLDQETTLSTMKVTELQNCGGNPTR